MSGRKGAKTEVAKNLVLSEAEFDEFKQYCHEKGLDLSYFGPEILGSKEEIEHYQFSRPQVIKLRKRRFTFKGYPMMLLNGNRKDGTVACHKSRTNFSRRGYKG